MGMIDRLRLIKSIAESYEGIKEGSKEHHQLIDDYNSILPHPRGYKMSYNDSWCAAYVSVVMLCSGISTFPYECGVMEMRDALWKQNCLIKGRLPHFGELIIYKYSHVGIILGSNDNTGYLLSMEGNASNKVKMVESNHLYDKNIQCYASPWKYSLNEIAWQVRNGWYGNGAERSIRLEQGGYNPEQVQKLVNEMIYKEGKNGLG